MQILITDCHRIPKDLIVECFSQPLSQRFPSFSLSAIHVFLFALMRNSILSTLGSISVDVNYQSCFGSSWGIHCVYFWG